MLSGANNRQISDFANFVLLSVEAQLKAVLKGTYTIDKLFNTFRINNDTRERNYLHFASESYNHLLWINYLAFLAKVLQSTSQHAELAAIARREILALLNQRITKGMMNGDKRPVDLLRKEHHEAFDAYFNLLCVLTAHGLSKESLESLLTVNGETLAERFIQYAKSNHADSRQSLLKIGFVTEQEWPAPAIQPAELNQPAAAPGSDQPAGVLLQMMNNYILRIDKNKSNNEINFKHGFSFFKDFRAKNRRATYFAVIAARDELKRDPQRWSEIITSTNLEKLRKVYEPTLGINSDDVNIILNEAEKMRKVVSMPAASPQLRH